MEALKEFPFGEAELEIFRRFTPYLAQRLRISSGSAQDGIRGRRGRGAALEYEYDDMFADEPR